MIKKEKSEKLGRVSTEMELILEHTQQGISHEVSFSLSIGEIVTHWFTLIVLSALRRSDNENMLDLVILILRSILTDMQSRVDGLILIRELKAVDTKLLSAPVSNKIEAQWLFKRNVPVTTLASGFLPAVPTAYALATTFSFPARF
nr:hypothetical protein [Tanacetum cinerariifolium]